MVVVLMCFVFIMGLGTGYIICDVNTNKRINDVKASCKRLNEMSEDSPSTYKVTTITTEPKEEIDMTAEIDFNNLNVFSIERSRNGDTILGYWKEKVVNGILIKDSGEWHLPIDNDQHLKLVEKFRNKMKKTEASVKKCSSS